MNDSEKQILENPIHNANVLSRISFAWMLRIFRTGYERDLEESDLYKPPDYCISSYLGDKVCLSWSKEMQSKKFKTPSLLRVFIKCFGIHFIVVGLAKGFYELIIKVVQTIIISKIVNYFSPKNTIQKTELAHYYALTLVACLFVEAFLYNHVFHWLREIGVMMNVASSTLIYRKLLRTSMISLNERTSSGQVLNLLTNDVGKFDHFISTMHYLWIAPIQIIIVSYIIYKNIRFEMLAGITFSFMIFIFFIFIAKKVSSAILKSNDRTDTRLNLINEIIRGILAVKIYTWERYFSSLVEKARMMEGSSIRRINILVHLNVTVEDYAAQICFLISLVTFIYSGNRMTAENIYMVMAFFNSIQFAAFYGFPNACTAFVTGIASIKRIEKFLNFDEQPNNPLEPQQETLTDVAVSFKKVVSKWSSSSERNVVDDVSFDVKHGRFVAVVGKIGSGKTSLLQVILKELPLTSGNLEINGRVVYACQGSWMFSSSVRQNIIFANPMNYERYEKVISACQLKRDFSSFPNGDKTVIGKLSLSGGQCARITLARAVYSDADIYLFDDPLSSVDTEVGRRIFNECFKTFLKGKTIIFVTHQIQYLKLVDRVLVLNEGRMITYGTFDEIQNSNVKLPEQSAAIEENEELSSSKLNRKEFESSIRTMEENPNNLETRIYGKISSEVYLSFFAAVNKWWLVLFVLTLGILNTVIYQGSDYFLSFWVNSIEAAKNETFEVSKKNLYVVCYSSMVLSQIILNGVMIISFNNMTFRASQNLHKAMLDSVTRASMRFFSANPSGRIMNRFSKDIGNIDMSLPIVLFETVDSYLHFLFTLVILSIINPLFIVSGGILLVLVHLLRVFYIRTSRSVKRLEGITRSPVYDHLSATLSGLATIRSSRAQERLKQEFDTHQDLHTASWHLFLCCDHAFSLYIDLLCCFYITFTIVVFFTFDKKELPGSVGLAILNSILLLNMLQGGIRQSAELENYMTSVERILQFTRLEKEPPLESESENKPRESWPEEGKIEFKDLYLMYRPDGNPVLKGLNFSIMSKEKIGIVGRTGGGKSSLIVALMRLAYVKGEIYIDNVPISSIGIHDLRSKISVIPQDPILFAGSIRTNLDPLNVYSDNILWQALEDVEMKKEIEGLAAGLQAMVHADGRNFSAGQRQLLLLARTIMKKNKILVLDEATANVDLQTDELIQKTIRKNFDDCTVLTISHRLNTIMNSSRVLIMDAGSVVEFDQPYTLLQKENGYFYELVQQAGSATAQILISIAEKAYNKKNN